MVETFEKVRCSGRAPCGAFPGKYWRALDADRGYPELFVRALTEGGFLAALIPAAVLEEGPQERLEWRVMSRAGLQLQSSTVAYGIMLRGALREPTWMN